MRGEKLSIVNIEDSDLKTTGLIQRLCVQIKQLDCVLPMYQISEQYRELRFFIESYF